jgi:hypothetical protein
MGNFSWLSAGAWLIFFIASAATDAGFIDSPAGSKNSICVAVMDFTNRGVDVNTSVGFSDRFRSSLPGKGKLTVEDVVAMDQVLQENEICGDRAGYNDSCLIEIGQRAGAQFVITGSVGRIDYLYTFNLKLIHVQTGKVIYSLMQDSKEPLEKLMGAVIPALAGKFHDEIIRSSFATLRIETVPDKAKLQLNTMEMGLTPLFLPDIEEGNYVIKLTHENCSNTVDSVFVKKGDTTYRFITLKPSEEYVKRQKTTIGLIQSIATVGVFGVFAGACYYEHKLRSIVDREKSIIRKYERSVRNVSFASCMSADNGQSPKYGKYKALRNISCICGGILAAGLTIGFCF